ncbi:hypothetical protein J6590_004630, partial [Homalodisca vitripennis]
PSSTRNIVVKRYVHAPAGRLGYLRLMSICSTTRQEWIWKQNIHRSPQPDRCSPIRVGFCGPWRPSVSAFGQNGTGRRDPEARGRRHVWPTSRITGNRCSKLTPSRGTFLGSGES